MKKIDRVILFNKSSTPIVMFEFQDDKITADPTLISGFLTAITNFSQELFNEKSDEFIITTGNRVITLFKYGSLIMSVFGQEGYINRKKKIMEALKFFTEHYETEIYVVQPAEFYEEFKYKLIRALFYVPIASDWIPLWKKELPNIEEIEEKYPIVKLIDGEKTIAEILSNAPQPIEKEVFYELLNYWYYYDYLTFHNTIEPRDYVYITDKLRNILSNNEEYTQLKNTLPYVPLTELINEINELKRIQDIIDKLGGKALEAIKYLYSKELVDIIDNKTRKIILVIDILQDILNILSERLKIKNFVQDVKQLLREMDSPLLANNIEYKGEKIEVNKKFLNDYIVKEDIDLDYSIWIEFIEKITTKYYKKEKQRKKINEEIHDRLINYYLPNCHDEEMEVLEMFLDRMEKMNA